MFFPRQWTLCQMDYKGKPYLLLALKIAPSLMEEADTTNK